MIGVSKRCCPTCRVILSRLSKELSPNELKSFFAEDGHKIITGCTIPDYLSIYTQHSLALYFCHRLRSELEVFISPPVTEGKSSKATGHKRFDSQDSVGFESSGASDSMSSSEAISGESDSASSDLES